MRPAYGPGTVSVARSTVSCELSDATLGELELPWFLLVADEEFGDNHALVLGAEGGPALCGQAEAEGGWFLAGCTHRLHVIDCHVCRARAGAVLGGRCVMTRDENPDPAVPTVQRGSRVRVRAANGEPETVHIRDESAPPAGSINPDSPLGSALMGHHIGDEVEVVLHELLPVRRLTIEAIE